MRGVMESNIHPELDGLFPFRGPCGLCGGPDARHRVWDAMLERVAAGDDSADVAADYGVSEQAVAAVVSYWTVDDDA